MMKSFQSKFKMFKKVVSFSLCLWEFIFFKTTNNYNYDKDVNIFIFIFWMWKKINQYGLEKELEKVMILAWGTWAQNLSSSSPRSFALAQVRHGMRREEPISPK